MARLAGMALLTAACAGGTPGPTRSIPPNAFEIRAVDLAFTPAQLSVPADQPFALVFDNADRAPHNVVIVGADGTRHFAGEIFTGAAVQLLDIPALASGIYHLRCDVHPEMSGDIEAVPATE